MPYIKQEKRKKLVKPILEMAAALHELSRTKDGGYDGLEGNLNFTITKIIDALYDPSYKNINNIVGVLECVKQEYYRRIAAPYEDKKVVENGDVYT